MICIYIWGIPHDTQEDELYYLRISIVKVLAELLEEPVKNIRVFFPKDRLKEPLDDGEGSKAVYASLDRSILNGKADKDDLARKITQALAELIWKKLHGYNDVKVAIGNSNPKWQTEIPT